jgi:cell division protein FtsB
LTNGKKDDEIHHPPLIPPIKGGRIPSSLGENLRLRETENTNMARRRTKRKSPKSNFFQKVKERTASKTRTVKKILLLLAFGFLAYRFFAGPYGFLEIHKLWSEKNSLEEESKALQAELIDMEIEKQRLTDDPFYLEKQARERLGMVREGEKVYRVIQEDQAKSAEETEPTQPAAPDTLSP